MWTLDELVERVRVALAAEYPGAPNGRVRDVPDRRAIRWYTTIGLVDRPLAVRGRTALYGPRHLQQLVAIKRRQAEGHSLADIQLEFSSLSDEALSGVSRVPPPLLAVDPQPTGHTAAARDRFWTDIPAGVTPKAAAPGHCAAAVKRAANVARPVSGVMLRGGAILVVPHLVSDRDRDDIAAAAAPLLDLLEARGLIDGRSS